MKFIHTSDWHLGHTLHEISREFEQRAFLDWLLETLEIEKVDALIVSGDIFDSANPPAQAQSLWYGFMAEARRRFKQLDVVVIGGNHDSAARLDAPEPLFRAFGVRVVGGYPFDGEGATDWDRVIVPLHDAGGAVCAWVAAVPFLRPADLPSVTGDDLDPLVEGVRLAYGAVLDEARRRREKGQAIVATGHCYMTGGVLSELSERKILGGNLHALPTDIFTDDVAYVALGHLHCPQTVGGREHVRYSGSPIPLSLSEAGYPNQVCLVELQDGRCAGIREIKVPRSVEMLRVPNKGALPVEALVEQLILLPPLEVGCDERTRPYLEVCAELERPEPGLRQRVVNALDGKQARLLKITPCYTGTIGSPLVSGMAGQGLHDLTPEEVFGQRYQSVCGSPPPVEILEAFHELLESVQQGEVLS